jgi:ABC-type dipeptide/oligopeptide/nickel transport system ATPase component
MRGSTTSEQAGRLAVENLHVRYQSNGHETFHAVRDVTIGVDAGHTLGIVGETGSGKSSVGLAMIGLLPPGTHVTGKVLIGDEDMLSCGERRRRQIRGRKVGMVFQDALSALNPVFTIKSQLVDTLRRHDHGLSRHSAGDRAGELFDELSIPRDRLRSYPHQLSGGMRQRALIATALASNPQFLIADESTSELDTVSQRTALDLLVQIQRARGLGMVVVSHDLAVISHVCETVAVLYMGQVVEYGDTATVLTHPEHWYTAGLVSVSAKRRDSSGRFYTLTGNREPDGVVVSSAQAVSEEPIP